MSKLSPWSLVLLSVLARVAATVEVLPTALLLNDVRAAYDRIPADTHGRDLQIKVGKSFPKGYNRGHMPYSEHFQGVCRARTDGDMTFFLAGSGLTEQRGHLFASEFPGGPGEPGEITDVERVDATYDHCGGLSIHGSYLVVGCEVGCTIAERLAGNCELRSTVHFYDIADPAAPKRLPFIVNRTANSAGASALAQDVDGSFLLLVAGWDSANLDLYRSTVDTGILGEEDPRFKLIANWTKDSLITSGRSTAVFGQYQNLNLLQQTDGQLFLIGTYRTYGGLGFDYMDLFKFDVLGAGEGSAMQIEHLDSKRLNCKGCSDLLPVQVAAIGFTILCGILACCFGICASVDCYLCPGALTSLEFAKFEEEGSGSDSHDMFSSLSGSHPGHVDHYWYLRVALWSCFWACLVGALISASCAWFLVRGVNFQAGAGVYVASPNDMYLYAVDWEPSEGFIAMKEFGPTFLLTGGTSVLL